MNIISVKNLTFSYSRDPVLRGISFDLKEKAGMAIYGSNGSGKSTLLKLLLGELRAKANTIFIHEKDVTQKKDWTNVGYVPQSNVSKNIAFPVTCEEILASSQYKKFGFIKMANKESYEIARSTLENFKLSQYAKTPFKELSGGLQQRVMIARAMLKNPELIILDEPTAGVDQKSNKEFLNTLENLKTNKGVAYIIVTHERKLVENILNLDAAYILEEGRLCNA